VPRALVLVVVVAAGIAATAAAPEPAWACSCAGEPAQVLLDRADAAFVGTYVGRRPAGRGAAVPTSADPYLYRFEVEQVVKGEVTAVVDVLAAESGASCGIELPEGARTGLTVNAAEGRWQSSLCQQVGAEELLAVAPAGREPSPVPPPPAGDVGRGFGRVSALLGAFVLVVAGGLFLIRRRYRDV